MTELVEKTLGSYHLLEVIGYGGMSTVYKAASLADDELVAIKVLSPHIAQDPKFRARFLREIDVLTTLRHPHIVPILDYGEQENSTYIVMPYMPLGTLQDRIKVGPVGPKEGARLISDIADALEYAHKRGVVHRDVKPSNILIDEESHAYLSDFGFAQIHDASLSLTGSVLIGTPAYMSPEQCQGQEVGPRSDQYSLAVVLYRLTTGHLPFDAETPLGIVVQHINEPLPRPRDINPNIPNALENVLLRALEKDPKRRFQSVSVLDEAFQDALLASLDPVTGKLKVDAIHGEGLATQVFDQERSSSVVALKRRLADRRSRLVLALLLLLLIACPFSAWRIFGFTPGGSNSPGESTAVAVAPMVNLTSTVASLSTAVASSAETPLSQGQLETAVAATLTALPTAIETVLGLGSPTAVSTENALTPSGTPLGGVSSPTPTPSIILAGSPQPSHTPSATFASGPSSTPSPGPSATSTLSPSGTPSPTPSRTPTPSQTPSLTPTRTPSVTPTTTPVDPCSLISVGNFRRLGNRAQWRLTNDGGTAITITRIRFDWLDATLELQSITLSSAKIWEGSNTPPVDISSGWSSGSRQVNSGSSATLSFAFPAVAEKSGYNLTVYFDNGCSVGFNN